MIAYKLRSECNRFQVFDNVIAHELGHYFVGKKYNFNPYQISIESSGRNTYIDDIGGACSLNIFEDLLGVDNQIKFIGRRIDCLCAGVASQFWWFYASKIEPDEVAKVFEHLWAEYGLDDLGKIKELARIYFAIGGEEFKDLCEYNNRLSGFITQSINNAISVLNDSRDAFGTVHENLLKSVSETNAGFIRAASVIDEIAESVNGAIEKSHRELPLEGG
ncbi:hypothetical protein I6G66_06160 [Delftia acidovorans]|uniref:Uncharacterized protein n=1 Tax=Delftia acidovorans TaxID=80866 RepID=A0A7T2S659_DELAC|nr:hypothetical protein [Delftia acidovorans]QPS09604.1 hypothetical protein I6G66_06160 [Delftia acidovorans]